MHNESSLIAAFVKRNKRDRYKEKVSDSRLRHKFTGQLAHFKDFDPAVSVFQFPATGFSLTTLNYAERSKCLRTCYLHLGKLAPRGI